jgi:hypothetical protein
MRKGRHALQTRASSVLLLYPILKNKKGSVRRTHFQIRSEAHDTYIILVAVWFFPLHSWPCYLNLCSIVS